MKNIEPKIIPLKDWVELYDNIKKNGLNNLKTNKIMVEEIKHFMCFKHELERINEGLILRGIDASSVISITDNGDEVVVWYKFKNK
jgi:hypothetical protein